MDDCADMWTCEMIDRLKAGWTYGICTKENDEQMVGLYRVVKLQLWVRGRGVTGDSSGVFKDKAF